jgi:hypothetical protein
MLTSHQSEELKESWEVTGMTRINLENENALRENFFLQSYYSCLEFPKEGLLCS